MSKYTDIDKYKEVDEKLSKKLDLIFHKISLNEWNSIKSFLHQELDRQREEIRENVDYDKCVELKQYFSNCSMLRTEPEPKEVRYLIFDSQTK